MDEETRKEASREWGEKYGREGESITNPDGVSEEFKEGFRKGSIGFGSNVMPKYFGRTGQARADWDCICGHTNRGRVRYIKENREICQLCGIPRELAEEAQRLEDA